MKRYLSPSQFYQLNIPDEWIYSEEDNLVSFYDDENGVGSLQISSYSIDDDYDFDMSSELAEFVAETEGMNKKDVLLNIKTLNNLISFTSIRNERYWEYYMLFENRKALFITYNSDEKNKTIEMDARQEIIQSIKMI